MIKHPLVSDQPKKMNIQLSLLILIVLYASSADSSCPGINNGEFEDLMNVMKKITCQSGGTFEKPAFLATLTPREVTLTSGSVVKFDSILTNIGSGYNANSGVFTAPRKGTYQFAVSFVAGHRDKEWLELTLAKNNNRLVRGHAASDPFTAGSLQAILELEKGDRIAIIQPRPSGHILGENYSMFSGHLI
ncbi:cerebellin-1-like [Mytilus californianus]|uniref:cerebellin-1-like n=1 Tax=Mytilus californianus TaxID=6549 RepID=UPI00224666A3|nr:cerebellin-1-like [Mytilus californianus]